jgi:hypothetical protein
MRIIGHMVTRNELGRWLIVTLPWLSEICNGDVAIYDDQSDDGTDIYVRSLGLQVERRPDVVPAFVEDESIFRWAAWRAMERLLEPGPGDWILAVDADELLVSTTAGADLVLVVTQLVDTIGAAVTDTVTFHVAEIFGFNGMGWPLTRTDGYWGAITACRLARWQPEGMFQPRREGGGSLPSTWTADTGPNGQLEIMHLGYARPEDRRVKHQRYTTGTGHNIRHVQSILEQPTLQHWAGMRPPL